MHMQCRDIIHDITAPPDDVMSEHIKMRFRRGTSEVCQHEID